VPLRRAGAPGGEQRLLLALADRTIPLTVRRHPRARRASLRVDVAGDGVVVTIPGLAPFADGIELAKLHCDWLSRRLAALPPRVAFDDGAVIPLRDSPHRIRSRPESPNGVRLADGIIEVGGPAASLPARLTRWLRAEARRQITAAAVVKAGQIDRAFRRISIRDTRARWGSCSAGGTLSFSWRLVLAPPTVLDYVVAHEVAHLAVAGHGPRFWATVAGLTGDMDDARIWLRHHGSSLHRYG
jgi:hypothetical protein